eukprot:TRINITY_DN7230_c0_g1_i1.p1 TRINITY_DN7230_c0_g1~~TRINITY_DN7230_c0_g1_i1.p1  ORF type:complete len:346 (-),score=51.99 TRINITY_DN7230_c0_g1_i1:15-1052(-)
MADILNLLAESKVLAAAQKQLQALASSDFGGAFKATFTDPKVAVPVFAQWPIGDVALFVHALATAVFVKKLVKGKQHSWLLHVLVFFFINFAGKTIESVLYALPLSWVLSDRAVAISFICWWVVNCSPLDIVGRVLTYGPLNLLLDVADSAVRTNALVRGLEFILQTYPDSKFAFFFLGTVGGASRALVTDLYRFAVGDTSVPSQFAAPSWPIKSAFYVALGYFLMLDPFDLGFFPPEISKPQRDFVIVVLKTFLVSTALLQPFVRGASPPPLNLLEIIFTTACGFRSAEYRARHAGASSEVGSKTSSKSLKSKPDAHVSGPSSSVGQQQQQGQKKSEKPKHKPN